MRNIIQTVVAAVVVAGVSASAAVASDAHTQPATWTSKETSFVSMGFTTRYSCDGLRDKIEAILLDLGARKKDLKVREQGCSEPSGRPSPMARVLINMSVLTPSATATGKTAVPADWKAVELRGNGSRYLAAGDCELVEQVQEQLLPLFTTRNLDSNIHCVPHQLSVTGPVLKVEVLRPAAAADAVQAAR